MLSINPFEKEKKLVDFLKASFKEAGFSRAVIGLSGGVDSATSCALVAKALGKENVVPVLLPYGDLNKQGTIDANLVIENLQIPKENVIEINIASAVEVICHSRKSGNPSLQDMDQVRKGNIMARVRMIYLFDQAKKQKALVVGTENKSEHLLGYFTRFGDEASDIEPLRSLYKTQVYQLAKHLGLPEIILTKAPTAGLWDGQTDEKEFGFTYQEADQVLSLLYDEKKTADECVVAGFSKDLAQSVMRRVKANEFKHKSPKAA